MSTKRLADLITLGRAAGALAFAGWALIGGSPILPWAAAFMLANWTGDVLDGALARRSPTARPTWIGSHDLEVDMWVAGCLLTYLALAGLVNARLAVGYALASVVVLAATGWPRALAMLCQAPIYAGFIFVVVERAPAAAVWLVLWPPAAVLLTWPKFPKVVVPEFLAGVRTVWDHRPGQRRKV